jgi:hypothetical protein
MLLVNNLVNEELLKSAIVSCTRCRNQITNLVLFPLSRNHYGPYCNEKTCLIANALPYYHNRVKVQNNPVEKQKGATK